MPRKARASAKSIRTMNREDVGSVVDVGRDAYGPRFGPSAIALMEGVRNSSILVSELPCELLGGEPEIAGFIALTLEPNAVRINSLCVAIEHRRKGVGSLLFRRALNKITARRPVARIMVPEVALDMQHFLNAHGARAVEVKRDFFESNDGTELMDGFEFQIGDGSMVGM